MRVGKKDDSSKDTVRFPGGFQKETSACSQAAGERKPVKGDNQKCEEGARAQNCWQKINSERPGC